MPERPSGAMRRRGGTGEAHREQVLMPRRWRQRRRIKAVVDNDELTRRDETLDQCRADACRSRLLRCEEPVLTTCGCCESPEAGRAFLNDVDVDPAERTVSHACPEVRF